MRVQRGCGRIASGQKRRGAQPAREHPGRQAGRHLAWLMVWAGSPQNFKRMFVRVFPLALLGHKLQLGL